MSATRSPELLRVREAAERLNVSRASVYRWIVEGRLPGVRLGGRGSPLRVPAGELEEWLVWSHVTPAERRVPEQVGVVDGAAAASPLATGTVPSYSRRHLPHLWPLRV
jgi:excisionase family DNA binding protein